ncbi:MAG: zinc-ribbon domain-containing protein [Clostridia bacterium]|nr:zinc-ribbon domain-containing protein [Clostridia bacterium]
METIFCTNCGHKMTDDSAFCGECGHRIAPAVSKSEAPQSDISNAQAPVQQSAPIQRAYYSQSAKGFFDRFGISAFFALASMALALPIFFELIKNFIVMSEEAAFALISNTTIGIFLCFFTMLFSLAGIAFASSPLDKSSTAKISKIICMIALAYAAFFLIVLTLLSLIGTASAIK